MKKDPFDLGVRARSLLTVEITAERGYLYIGDLLVTPNLKPGKAGESHPGVALSRPSPAGHHEPPDDRTDSTAG